MYLNHQKWYIKLPVCFAKYININSIRIPIYVFESPKMGDLESIKVYKTPSLF